MTGAINGEAGSRKSPEIGRISLVRVRGPRSEGPFSANGKHHGTMQLK